MSALARWTVLSLDMWGHVSADCCAAYGCPCVREEDGAESHDDDACQCHEDCNAHYACGAILLAEDTDDATVLCLLADGYLTEEGARTCTVDESGDGWLDILDSDGRRILSLSRDADE